MRLIIAEKPSVGRAIAEAFPGAKQKTKLSITLENGDMISWVAGHILEPAQPAHYDPKYKSWRMSDLPIIPSAWKLNAKAETKDLLMNIKDLLKQADVVVNAGDADREGQLLIDEVLDFLNFKGRTQRVLLTDLTPGGIRKAFENLRDNKEFAGLSNAALARQRGDWVVGLNLTRAYSLASGGKSIVSIGRVQTPTLALVVNRDKEVEGFVSKPFYEVKAYAAVIAGNFWCKWIPDENKVALDEKGRLLDRAVAETFASKIEGAIGNITKYEAKDTKTAPPLMHTLSTLQIECSKKYDIAPDRTLAIVQGLYERKIVSYPRSDCAYVPESLFDEREKTLAAIAAFGGLASEAAGIDASLKSKTWNSEKVEEHHGIIPTGANPGSLSDEEAKVFDTIARRYLAQFFDAQIHAAVTIEAKITGELFRAASKQERSPGWKSLYKSDKEEKSTDEEDEVQLLPTTFIGEQVGISKTKIDDKKTTPPEYFTEATLLEAMNSIHRFVSKEEIRAVLKETSGIGTAATQATIITTLFRREFLIKDKKKVRSTDAGRSLIAIAPEALRTPDLTALWEMKLRDIAGNKLDFADFLQEVYDSVANMLTPVRENKEAFAVKVAAAAPATEKKGYACPACGKNLEQRNGKNGRFWACYSCGMTVNACGMTVNDEKGKPQKVQKCPACGHFAARFKGPHGYFWSCRNQACKKTFSDKAPAKQGAKNK